MSALYPEDVYALLKKYTDKSIAGAGAIAGKNCQIQSIEDIANGKRITFAWYDNDNVLKTDTINVTNGISPEISVVKDTSSSYVLHISTADDDFDTPNLKGGGGSGGTTDYNELTNKPTINGAELSGDMELSDIGDVAIADDDIIAAVNLAFGNP